MSTEKDNFIRAIVRADVQAQKNEGAVVTRFPPEPNGYLHIGHAKAICLDFSIAAEFGGRCHLRFDDTNPEKEEQEYIDSIREDVRWLGFDWKEHEYFASDYFELLYQAACTLIKKGLAYVDDQNAEQIRLSRGTLTQPGVASPFRDRSVEENLHLFEQMRAGVFENGAKVLRAKIDMAHPNITMRDPALYRIKKVSHHRTGSTWCIYPMYDFTHPLSDAFEGVTHSLCTLEFEDHRPLYDWVVQHVKPPVTPRQYEFARLNLTHTLMSKRRWLDLIRRKVVRGWDDPRVPTISGLRRRGYTPEAIRAFCAHIGVTKKESIIEYALLEHFIREDLNKRAARKVAIQNPLRVIITNYPEASTETRQAINNPEDPDAGKREITFGREILIERDDFMIDPPKKFFRLAPGREVRLRYGYFLTCNEVVYAADGSIDHLLCTYDPQTSGGKAPDGRKVKSTIHWLYAPEALKAQIRLYNPLFTVENPSAVEDVDSVLNPDSEIVLDTCYVEPSAATLPVGEKIQFERLGYYTVDKDSNEQLMVFNRIVTLKDAWQKISNKKK